MKKKIIISFIIIFVIIYFLYFRTISGEKIFVNEDIYFDKVIVSGFKNGDFKHTELDVSNPEKILDILKAAKYQIVYTFSNGLSSHSDKSLYFFSDNDGYIMYRIYLYGSRDIYVSESVFNKEDTSSVTNEKRYVIDKDSYEKIIDIYKEYFE